MILIFIKDMFQTIKHTQVFKFYLTTGERKIKHYTEQTEGCNSADHSSAVCAGYPHSVDLPSRQLNGGLFFRRD